MAMLGPIALLALLATWLVLIMAGYTLMYLAVTEPVVSPNRSSCPDRRSSPSGPPRDPGSGRSLLTYTEAGAGPVAGGPAHHLPAQHLRGVLAAGERRGAAAGAGREPADGRQPC